jgi:hypothetical protein
MKLAAATLALAIIAVPAPARAQTADVDRRVYTFLDNRLEVAVVTDAPGELQVVRGERGRIEVASRSSDGFAGAGLGGALTRQLRLTAVGTGDVQYLVVVPEHVNVRVYLPDGESATLASSEPAASFSWGRAGGHGLLHGDWDAHSAGPPGELAAMAPTTTGGLYVVHDLHRAPAVVDLPDLAAVRSLSLRFEGNAFRIAASRPLRVEPGSPSRMELRIAGEPTDIVLYIPRDAGGFTLTAAGNRVAETAAGRPRALCGNVIVQEPTPHQIWLTFRPQTGRLDCR